MIPTLWDVDRAAIQKVFSSVSITSNGTPWISCRGYNNNTKSLRLNTANCGTYDWEDETRPTWSYFNRVAPQNISTKSFEGHTGPGMTHGLVIMITKTILEKLTRITIEATNFVPHLEHTHMWLIAYSCNITPRWLLICCRCPWHCLSIISNLTPVHSAINNNPLHFWICRTQI